MARSTDEGGPAVSPAVVLSDADIRTQLAAQPKVKIRLRQSRPGEVQMPDETVCINGYIFQIRRGVEVSVPQSVADILYAANL